MVWKEKRKFFYLSLSPLGSQLFEVSIRLSVVPNGLYFNYIPLLLVSAHSHLVDELRIKPERDDAMLHVQLQIREWFIEDTVSGTYTKQPIIDGLKGGHADWIRGNQSADNGGNGQIEEEDGRKRQIQGQHQAHGQGILIHLVLLREVVPQGLVKT